MSFVKETIISDRSAKAPTLDLHEIQTTVLRLRLASYFGAHVLLRVDDARAGRELLRWRTADVESAASWWNATGSRLSVAISYAGLQPSESLRIRCRASRRPSASEWRSVPGN